MVMKNMRRSTLFVTILLAGCSPYGWSGSVASFRDSVAESQVALNEGLANLKLDTLSRQNARFVATRAPVQTTASCGYSSAVNDQGNPQPPCVLIQRGSKEPSLPPVYVGEAGARKKLAVLLRYAEAMAELTNATDRKALDAATDNLAGSASALAATANPAAIAAAPVIGAAIKAAGVGLALALDYERRAVLKRTVNETDSHVAVIATGLGTYFETLRIARFEQVFGEANFRAERVGKASAKEYASALMVTQERMAAANALRAANGSRTGAAIVEAHAKLVAATNDSSADAVQLAVAVGELADAARALKEALSTRSSARSGS